MNRLSEHLLTDPFDPGGVNLVEAAAGTGKTYSIETLYLRLVVTHGVAVDRLLVVTFTEAATAELRERLRAVLEECRRQIEGEAQGEGRIAAILRLPWRSAPGGDVATTTGRDLPLRRVRRALLDFDKATIFTIHGFCQRTLNEFAFECGQDFDADVITGDALLAEICTDRWRTITYRPSRSIVDDIVKSTFPAPVKLIRIAKAYVARHGVILQPETNAQDLAAAGDRLVNALATASALAAANGTSITEDLGHADSKPFFPGGQHHLVKQIERFGDRRTTAAEQLEIATSLCKTLAPRKQKQHLPEGVLACIEACRHALQMAEQHHIRFSRRTGALTLPEAPDIRSAWNTALEAASRQLHRHCLDFERAEITCRRYPEAFAGSAITDPHTRAACFESIHTRHDETIIAALKSITQLRIASRTVAWRPAGATVDFIAGLQAAVDASRIPFADMVAARELKEIARLYDIRKRDERSLTFDDMPVRLLQAINRNPAVAAAVRQSCEAALIDEFQDTDPVQYQIFTRLFAQSSIPLFLVGDPKQAIYSFRGGDIYTYCTARQAVRPEKRYNLTTNYRSQVPLVRAVNTIFRDRPDAGSLFGHPSITYAHDVDGNGLDECFQEQGVIDTRPFKIWRYRLQTPATARRRPAGADSPVAGIVYRDVADEIVRLLNDDTTGFQRVDPTAGGVPVRRLRASDIAVLVRRHREAACIYRELRRRGVPTVRQCADNVFDATEAHDLLYVLRAMLEPGNVNVVRTALASRLIPVSENELIAISNHDTHAAHDATIPTPALQTLEDWLVLFRDANERWQRTGFIAAFARLAGKAGIQAHLAAQVGGERKLVNVIQLTGLLHRTATGQTLGPTALLEWYSRQLDSETREADDAFETRLESDEDAVQIMTLFKSKGLEFPVVFVPTLWTGRVGETKTDGRLYHDEDVVEGTASTGDRLPAVYMHLDSNNEQAKALATREREQEDIRNFYVAATRASFRTYVVAGDLCGEDSTLGKCLPPERLEHWQQTPESGIDVIDRNGSARSTATFRPTSDAPPLALRDQAVVDKSRGHASFSSIAPQETDITISAATSQANNVDAEDATLEEDPDEPSRQLDIFTFPAGARTGDCWHRIFEQIDFCADDATIRRTVSEQLALFRLDRGSDGERETKRAITFNMVRRVLDSGIDVGGQGTLRLRDIPSHRRRAEMAFHFALQGSGRNDDDQQRNAVWTVLRHFWTSATDGSAEALFLQRLKNWKRQIPDGFMTGFIDLFFEHQGRYYILDWKSNRLGGQPAHFNHPGLMNEMAAHAYFLQYLIYTVAIDRHLRQSLANYDYQRDVGGVIYLFLRGMDGQSQRGIYYTKPPEELILGLSKALGTTAGGGL